MKRDSNGRFVKGMTPWNKGLTKDTDKRVREYGKKGSITNTGRKLSEEHKRKIRETMKRWAETPEGRAEILRASKAAGEANKVHMRKLWANSEYRETAGKKSLAIIHARLKDPEVQKKRIRGLIKHPNKAEQQLNEIIQKHSLPFRYVGDGEVIIDGKNPDFIATDGQKRIIELFDGEYWHNPKRRANMPHHQTYEGTMEHYARNGFDATILFVSDLPNESMIVNQIVGVV